MGQTDGWLFRGGARRKMGVERRGLLELFCGQVPHAYVLQPLSDHPMKIWVLRRSVVALLLIRILRLRVSHCRGGTGELIVRERNVRILFERLEPRLDRLGFAIELPEGFALLFQSE